MAAKKKAAKGAAGAIAAGQALRDNPYVQRLVEDDDLRDELRSAFDSARKAYGRIDRKGPAKALENKKVQRDLKQAADSLKSAADFWQKDRVYSYSPMVESLQIADKRIGNKSAATGLTYYTNLSGGF